MQPTPDEINFSGNDALTEVNEIIASGACSPTPVSKQAVLIDVLKQLPFLTGFIRNMIEARNAATQLVTLASDLPPDSLEVVKSTQFVGLALRAVDFIRIPLIYIAALSVGEKPPFTLSNNGKWLYAASLLALSLVALTLPATAPIIAIAAPSLVLTVSLYSFGKLYYDYRQNKIELGTINNKLNEATINFEDMKRDAEALKKDFTHAIQEKEITLAGNLSNVIKNLSHDVAVHKNTVMQPLTDRQHVLEEKMHIESEMMERAIGIGFASFAVIGAVTTLFFPPLGLGILISVGVVSGAYALGKLAEPHVTALSEQRSTKNQQKSEAPLLDENLNANINSPKPEEIYSPLHKESSSQMLKELGGLPLKKSALTNNHQSIPSQKISEAKKIKNEYEPDPQPLESTAVKGSAP